MRSPATATAVGAHGGSANGGGSAARQRATGTSSPGRRPGGGFAAAPLARKRVTVGPRRAASRPRRPARRRGMGDGDVRQRLRPGRTGGGRPRERGDRGLDGVRPRPPLLRVPRPLHRSGDDPGQPGRPGRDRRRRPHVGPVRSVPRPAAGVPVQRERVRRPERRARQRRRQPRRVPRPVAGIAIERRQPRRAIIGRRRQRAEQLGAVRHPRGPFVERALRNARTDGRGRLDGGDGHPVQEPPLSGARGRGRAALGLPDHARDPREVRGAVVVADLARGGGAVDAVRRPWRDSPICPAAAIWRSCRS